MRRLPFRLIRYLIWLLFLWSLVLLSSCNRPGRVVTPPPPQLPYKVDGASDKAAIKMQENFNKNDIKVVSLGQNYLISIPSSALFFNQTPRLTWASYALLNDIACYLKQFRKVSIYVTAYSSKCGSVQRERALTLARARAVGDYLWSQNIDGRFIFTQGLGSDKPIVKYNQGGDNSANSRIEITFRDVVA